MTLQSIFRQSSFYYVQWQDMSQSTDNRVPYRFRRCFVHVAQSFRLAHHDRAVLS